MSAGSALEPSAGRGGLITSLPPEIGPATGGSYGRGSGLRHDRNTVLDLWFTIAKHRWTVLSFIVVVMTLVALYSFRVTPQYDGIARIAIDGQDADLLGIKGNSEVSQDWDYTVALETQVRVLKSEVLASQVIRDLKLDTKPAFAGSKKVRPAAPAALNSTTVADIDPAYLKKFAEKLTVNIVPHTRIVEVHFLSSDARMSAEVANALSQDYLEQNFRTRYESTMQASEWLSHQLADLRVKMEAAQEQLVRYQKEHGILGLDEKQNIITQKLDELNKELTSAEADRIQKESLMRLVGSSNAELVARLDPNSMLQKLRQQESDLRSQYAEATVELGPDYPKVQKLKSQLNAVQASIANETSNLATRIRNDYRAAIGREQMLRDALEKQKTQANQLNESAIQYSGLKREADTTRDLYDGLQKKVKEASVVAGLHSNNVRIVDRARPPEEPTTPNIPRNLIVGFIFALSGAIALAFSLEMIDTTLRSLSEIEAVSGMAALGAIPAMFEQMPGQTNKRSLKSGKQIGRSRESMALVTSRSPKSTIAECYRALRTSILLSGLGAPPKVILITSAMPQEGKTTTAINTATVLAQRGMRVLLVDADMRKPSLHSALNLRPSSGLSNLLSGTSKMEDAIVASTMDEKLFLLPAGPVPPHPSELLGSILMKQYIARWREEYDHVVIDTPPVLSVTDSVVLSVDADSVIVVVRSGRTTREALRRTCEILRQVNARIMGVVVNAFDVRRATYGDGYGTYGAYSYGYGYGIARPEE